MKQVTISFPVKFIGDISRELTVYCFPEVHIIKGFLVLKPIDTTKIPADLMTKGGTVSINLSKVLNVTIL